MKGPRSRHKFYIVRIWECPACKKRVYTPVQVVQRQCACQGVDSPAWMVLIEEEPLPARKKVPPPEPPAEQP